MEKECEKILDDGVYRGEQGHTYWQKAKEYREWSMKEKEKEKKVHDMTCHNMTKDDFKNSSHVHNMTQHDIFWKQLTPKQYAKLLSQLEMWGVYAPKAIVKKYGALKCWQAMEMTLFKKPKVAGAFFTACVRN